MAESMDVVNSILNSTKKALGIAPDYDAFDPDIIMHINGVFSTLNQIGIGPEEGFAIYGDSETWDAFVGVDPRYNGVKTYVFLKVRYVFDPPANSFTLNAMKEQIQEHEWRLSVLRESGILTPTVAPIGNPALLVDGGEGSVGLSTTIVDGGDG